MTTGTHIIGGVIVSLFFHLPVIPAAIGSVIPDIDIKKGFPKGKRTLLNAHRGITHHPLIPITIGIGAVYIENLHPILSLNLLSFSAGYMSHLLLDMLTPLGIPYTTKYNPRISLKLLKSGKIAEIIVSLTLLIILVKLLKNDSLNIKTLIGRKNISFLKNVLQYFGLRTF